MLRENRHLVAALCNALLEKEELTEREIAQVIEGADDSQQAALEDDVLVDLRDAQDRIRR